jgi:hypothetical protein
LKGDAEADLDGEEAVCWGEREDAEGLAETEIFANDRGGINLQAVESQALFVFVEKFGFVAVLGEIPVCEETDCGGISSVSRRALGWNYCLHTTVKEPSMMNRYRHASILDLMWNTPNDRRPEKALAMFDAA